MAFRCDQWSEALDGADAGQAIVRQAGVGKDRRGARGRGGAALGGARLAIFGHHGEARVVRRDLGDRLGGALGDLADALLGDAGFEREVVERGGLEHAALDDLAIAAQLGLELLQLGGIDAMGGGAQARPLGAAQRGLGALRARPAAKGLDADLAELVDIGVDELGDGALGEIVGSGGLGAGDGILVLDHGLGGDLVAIGGGEGTERDGGGLDLLGGGALVGHQAEAQALELAADLPVHEGGELGLGGIIGFDRAVDGDGTALLGIFPMRGQAILADEVADARGDQLEDLGKGAVDIHTLAVGTSGAVLRCILDDGSHRCFQRDRDLRHCVSPVSSGPAGSRLPFTGATWLLIL